MHTPCHNPTTLRQPLFSREFRGFFVFGADSPALAALTLVNDVNANRSIRVNNWPFGAKFVGQAGCLPHEGFFLLSLSAWAL
jgi:hypothetical protein